MLDQVVIRAMGTQLVRVTFGGSRTYVYKSHRTLKVGDLAIVSAAGSLKLAEVVAVDVSVHDLQEGITYKWVLGVAMPESELLKLEKKERRVRRKLINYLSEKLR